MWDWAEMIKKEEKAGYYDASIFGGFSQALESQAKAAGLSSLARLAQEYGQAPLVQRPALLKKIANAALALPPPAPKPAEKRVDAGSLSMPVQYIKGVGPKRAALFQRLGIHTMADLLFYFPRDYQDRSLITPIADLAYGEQAVIKGEVLSLTVLRPRPRMTVLKALVQDESGSIAGVWFNQAYLEKQLVRGRKLFLFGRLESKYRQREFLVQDFEFAEENAAPLSIIPVYASTEALKQKAFRNIMALAWQRYGHLIGEILPPEMLQRHKLLPRRQAVEWMHFPPTMEQQEKARQTLAYEEFFLLQLALLKNESQAQQPGLAHPPLGEKWAAFEKALTFTLMPAQKRVIKEIFTDMESPFAMTRLLQGDVGSGKTVVAAAALYKAAAGGYQGAMMAPTEILARQHYQNWEGIFASLGLTMALFTGALKGKARERLLEEVKGGKIDILIGTHTLIQEGVEIPRLGLAITDEQHRFGVRQRATLVARGGNPDFLVMTATPIPRTLALTLYGDLRISVIDQRPPDRLPIKTYGVDEKLEKRVFRFLDKEIAQGRQVFVICPLVEESEKMDLQSAVQLAQRLQEKVFPHRRVGLLHGKLKSKEKEAVMEDFRLGKIDILVATTVIEVGIDIPNATVMLVQDAHRFGLAQLHQLRGRIGRGAAQSYCILMHEAKSEVARERIRVMTQTEDGFAIAEADLRLRGPGEFLGLRQHGIPELKTANLFRDGLLLEQARGDAQGFLASSPDWQKPELAALSAYLQEKYQFLN